MGATRRVALSLGLLALGAGGLVGAPSVAAGCNDSSGTVVCAQGDIRGTHGAPPARAGLGSWGTWCTAAVCYSGGYGVLGAP